MANRVSTVRKTCAAKGSEVHTFAEVNYGGDLAHCVAVEATTYGGLIGALIGGYLTSAIGGGYPGAFVGANAYGAFVCSSLVCVVNGKSVE